MVEEKELIAENVTTYLKGIRKVVIRKSKVNGQILTEKEGYFLGIQYKKTSELRGMGIMDNIVQAIGGGRA